MDNNYPYRRLGNLWPLQVYGTPNYCTPKSLQYFGVIFCKTFDNTKCLISIIAVKQKKVPMTIKEVLKFNFHRLEGIDAEVFENLWPELSIRIEQSKELNHVLPINWQQVDISNVFGKEYHYNETFMVLREILYLGLKERNAFKKIVQYV